MTLNRFQNSPPGCPNTVFLNPIMVVRAPMPLLAGRLGFMGINTSSSPPRIMVCFSFINSYPAIESEEDATDDLEVSDLANADLGGAR